MTLPVATALERHHCTPFEDSDCLFSPLRTWLKKEFDCHEKEPILQGKEGIQVRLCFPGASAVALATVFKYTRPCQSGVPSAA